MRTSLRLHGASADELPPLEEVERKARMVRRLMKEQNSPKKENEGSPTQTSQDTKQRSAQKPSSGLPVKTSSGLKSGSNKFPFKRKLSSSSDKKPVKKSIWDASRYSTRRRRRRRRIIAIEEDDEFGDNDEEDNENVEESDHECIDHNEDNTESVENSCERVSDMDITSPLEAGAISPAGARSPRSRHQSGTSADVETRSHKDSISNCLSIEVETNSPMKEQKSTSLQYDSQRPCQSSPRLECQKSPRSESQCSPRPDGQRSSVRSDNQRSPARSDSQRSSRLETQRSSPRSPRSDHLYSRQLDQDSPNTPNTQESPQRSFRPSSGQRSPRQSAGGKSPRRQDSDSLGREANKTNTSCSQGDPMETFDSSIVTAQKVETLQGYPQESISQAKKTVPGVETEVISCDSGIGSSESSADSNDSTGKAKELLKAKETQQEEITKVILFCSAWTAFVL